MLRKNTQRGQCSATKPGRSQGGPLLVEQVWARYWQWEHVIVIIMMDRCLKHVIREACAIKVHFRRLSLPALSILSSEPAFDFPQFCAVHALGQQLTTVVSRLTGYFTFDPSSSCSFVSGLLRMSTKDLADRRYERATRSILLSWKDRCRQFFSAIDAM